MTIKEFTETAIALYLYEQRRTASQYERFEYGISDW